jgi:hypothetical protein
MAERIVSPGVFTRENDLSFIAQGIGEIGGAFIGPFKQGPAFLPTVVRTQSEFEEIFGTPDGTYYTEYAVQNYLREAGTATIVRVGGVGGYVQNAPLAIVASGSSAQEKIVGVLYNTNTSLGIIDQNGDGFTSNTQIDQQESGSGFITLQLTGSDTFLTASVLPSSTTDISDTFGTSPTVNTSTGKSAYSYLYFENNASRSFSQDIGGDLGVDTLVLPNQDYSYDVRYASTPWIRSQNISGTRHNLFKFHTLGDGTVYNKKFKVGISNVKAAGEDGSTDYSTFTVTVRSFDDTDRRKTVLETYNNVNLDPASPNYIARVIGDTQTTIDSSGKITETGDYRNRSKYVRVEVSEPGTFPISAGPFGHEGYAHIINDNNSGGLLPDVVYTTGSFANTTSNPLNFSGIVLDNINFNVDNKQIFGPIPESVNTTYTDFSFDGQNMNVEGTGGISLALELTGSSQADMVARQFVVGFQEGFDGLNPITKPLYGSNISAANTQGFNCATSTSSGSIAYAKAIAAVSNPDEFDINLVVTPGIIRRLHPSVTTETLEMVEARQDCFYLADLVESTATISTVVDQAAAIDSNYVGTYYPWVKTIDTNTNKLTEVPPSVLLPAVYASNDAIAAEWFAPAGLNRGGITGAVSVLNRLTHSERDTLYEGKVNPIAVFPGQGIVAYGQKTLQDRASALDRINVRRLLIAVKKFVASTSRFLVFEQNTSQTRARFLNTVNPYFESIQQRQGLYAFNVVMDESNNTPDVIDRNILAGQIYLQPAKTAEFIVIDFNILPTGASFSA